MQFCTFSFSPFLNIDLTVPIFHSFGTFPPVHISFIISLRFCSILSLLIHAAFIILSCPGAFPFFSFFITSLISFIVIFESSSSASPISILLVVGDSFCLLMVYSLLKCSFHCSLVIDFSIFPFIHFPSIAFQNNFIHLSPSISRSQFFGLFPFFLFYEFFTLLFLYSPLSFIEFFFLCSFNSNLLL